MAGSNREVTAPDSLDITIADDDAPGVLILQTGESTDVIEPSDAYLIGGGFLSQVTSASVELKQPATLPLVVGQTWTIQLTVQNSTQGAPPVNYLFGYTVAGGDQLSTIATALADRINDIGLFGATSATDNFVLVKSTSAFTLSLKVSDNVAVLDYSAATQAQGAGVDLVIQQPRLQWPVRQLQRRLQDRHRPSFTSPTTNGAGPNSIGTYAFHLTGTPVAGASWSVELTVGGQTRTFSHVVSAADGTVETLAEVAAALAAKINADPQKFTNATVSRRRLAA